MGLCGNSYDTHDAKHFDPIYDKGGRAQRSGIYDYLSQANGAARADASRAAGAASAGASDPGWANLLAYSNKVVNGDYLKTPDALQAVMDRNRMAGRREASDTSANIRSQFARNGMGFSTANEQAEQAAQAAATARADDTNTGAALQNYMAERNNQNGAGALLAQAINAPADLYSKASIARFAPAAAAAQLIQGLSGNGQVAAPTMTEHEDEGRQVLSSIGKL